MSLLLIVAGAALVAIALFNRVPRLSPGSGAQPAPRGRLAAPARPRPRPARLELVPARLTETGRATLTTLGGSVLIIAFFLALSGV